MNKNVTGFSALHVRGIYVRFILGVGDMLYISGRHGHGRVHLNWAGGGGGGGGVD